MKIEFCHVLEATEQGEVDLQRKNAKDKGRGNEVFFGPSAPGKTREEGKGAGD